MNDRYRLGILMLALGALLLGACRDKGLSPPALRIESLDVTVEAEGMTIGGSAAAIEAFGTDLTAVAPAARVHTLPDVAGALAAVRDGAVTAAIVPRAAGSAEQGLKSVEFQVQPVAAFVPFTFPVEEVTAQQARQLAAGRIRNWRELGGPALAVQVATRGTEAVRQALNVELSGATLAAATEARGRVLFAGGAYVGPSMKPLRIDGYRPGEQGYPFAVTWSVVARADDQRAAALGRALAGRLAEQADREVVIDAVGDIMLDRSVGASIAQRGPRFPFEAVMPLLAGSHIRLANLELPLTERGQRARKDYTFRAPPSVVEGLRAAGFNLLTLANNHVLDYGPEGLLDTMATLDRAGIPYVGAGRNAEAAHAPVLLAVQGLRIAVLGYVNTPNDGVSGWVAENTRAGAAVPGVAWGTADAIRRDVAAARARADLVVVALHAGWEYTGPPSPVQRQLAYAAIDAGAALVLGAHPHVLQGIEFYKDAPIVYSLGNFVFDLDDDDRRQPGLPSVLTGVLRVRLGPEGVRSLELRPAVIDETNGRPVPVSGAAARPVYERLYTLTDALAGGR
jgi:poly-gamma-glutamate synthesis protein (capsule biosynthesis protein)